MKKKITKKLGKLPVKHDHRTLMFAKYTENLPKPPPSCSWQKTIGTLGMMLNDQFGDCVVAGYAHAIQSWTGADVGNPHIISDDVIKTIYFQLTGGPDTGLIMLDACKYWRASGLDGHKITAFASIQPADTDDVKRAISWYGCAYVGVILRQFDMTNFDRGRPWITTPKPGKIVGGHCIPIVGYDNTNLYCITWGKIQPMNWAWFNKSCEEAYCLLPEIDWTNGDQKNPLGQSLQLLVEDLSKL